MTAGTRFSEDYDDPASDVRVYERAAGWQPSAAGEDGPDLVGYMVALPNERAHGELFEYRSILTDVLAIVLEHAAGERLAEADEPPRLVADRRRVRRRGHRRPPRQSPGRRRLLGHASRSRAARPAVPAERLRAGTPGRAAAWVSDTRFADAECRRTFLASPEAASPCAPRSAGLPPAGHYRNQWWVLDPGGVLLAAGIYGQYLYVDVAADVVLAKLSSLPSPLDIDVSADTLSAFAAVAARLRAPQ